MKRFLTEIFKMTGAVVGTLLFVTTLTACELIGGGDDDGGMPIYKSKAWLTANIASYNEKQLTGGLQGDPNGEYQITLTTEGSWASLS